MYLESLHVRYGIKPREMPYNALDTLDENARDINHKMGGKIVWLVPRWKEEPKGAVSHVWVHIEPEHRKGTSDDLAAGAGGDYRTLSFYRNSSWKITDICLMRRSSPVYLPEIRPLGYEGISRDINEGRGGDHLYLIWKFEKLDKTIR